MNLFIQMCQPYLKNWYTYNSNPIKYHPLTTPTYFFLYLHFSIFLDLFIDFLLSLLPLTLGRSVVLGFDRVGNDRGKELSGFSKIILNVCFNRLLTFKKSTILKPVCRIPTSSLAPNNFAYVLKLNI